MARSTEMKNYRLSKLSFLTDEERMMVESATALMPLFESLLERELQKVEAKLDSETMYDKPAYKEYLVDLIAQRRTLKKLKKLFETIEE